MPNSGFVGYVREIVLAEAHTVGLPLSGESEFFATAADVTSPSTAKSRVMLPNSPNNPAGAVFSHDDAAPLARVAVERDMIVISDEVYEKIVYNGAKHYCMVTLGGMRERTLVINSFSRTYAMRGLRGGIVVGSKELIAPLWLKPQYMLTCVDRFSLRLAWRTLHKSFLRRLS
jgi:aspartate/methionine/tyrosine aminotransferase